MSESQLKNTGFSWLHARTRVGIEQTHSHMGWKLPFCDRINAQDQGGHNLAVKEEGKTCTVRRHERAIEVIK